VNRRIDIIAGARPNFMKVAPIIRALKSNKVHHGLLQYRLVHTGQHYDVRMSGDFFEQHGHSAWIDWPVILPGWVAAFLPNVESEIVLALSIVGLVPTYWRSPNIPH